MGYITTTRTPRCFHVSGVLRASEVSFAIIGHMKHSVLPEPVPVATNKSFPSMAVSSALIWCLKGAAYTPKFASANFLKKVRIHSGILALSMPFGTETYAGDDSI